MGKDKDPLEKLRPMIRVRARNSKEVLQKVLSILL